METQQKREAPREAGGPAPAERIDANMHYRVGRAWLSRRQWDLAIASFNEALRLEPRRADLHVGLGLGLLARGSLREAVTSFLAALMANPRDLDACRHLALAYELLGESGEAVGAWYGLGTALAAADRFDEAVTAYRRVVALKANHVRALVKLGQLHMERAQPDEAAKYFEATLAIKPEHRQAKAGLSWARQLLGDIAFGWENLAWMMPQSARRREDLEHPVWDGSALNGRTILLWCDWALGDAIQFVRFAKAVKGRGGRVVLQCDRALVDLFESIPDIDCVIPREFPLPHFDVHAPVVLVPGLMGPSFSALSDSIPYLRPPQQLVDAWRRRLGTQDGLIIGIVWAGRPTPRFRSTSLSWFSRLAAVPGVRMVSLQVGPAVTEFCAAPDGFHVERLLPESPAITQTAALIQNLDLVITVDTMVAHLAGALGKKVWTLVPFAPSFRWQLRGDASPWYPTMRLFRQTRPREWSDVFERVRSALMVLAKESVQGERPD